MDKKLQDKLFKRFKFMYRGIDINDKYERNTIECGDGWFDIIWRACIELEKVLKKESKDIRDKYSITLIKEKFGRLAIYNNSNDNEINSIIIKAEGESYDVCEECGKPAKLRRERIGRQLTLCNKHNKQYK